MAHCQTCNICHSLILYSNVAWASWCLKSMEPHHWKINWLFNSLFRLTTKNNTSKLYSADGWISLIQAHCHYSDVIMSTMAFQITSVSLVCSTICWGADQRKHQSTTLLAFVRRIHRWPVNSPHKGPVTQKMFPFDDVIMDAEIWPVDFLHKRSVMWKVFPCHDVIMLGV